MLELLFQGNLADGRHVLRVPIGRWRGFLFMYEGDAAAGVTIANTDLGRIRQTIDGRQLKTIHADRLQVYNNLKGGIVDTTSAAAGAFSFSAYLPEHVFFDSSNILDVDSERKVEIETEYIATIATLIDSGTIRIYGVRGNGVQAYLLKIGEYDMNLAAGSPTEKIPLEYENIAQMYICNAANLTSLIAKVDGQIAVNAQRLALVDQTLVNNQLETLAINTPYFEIDLCKCKSLIETLNESFYFDFTTAGAIAPLNSMIFACDYTPDQLTRSQSAYQSDYAARVNRKANSGKTRPLQVLEMLQKLS